MFGDGVQVSQALVVTHVIHATGPLSDGVFDDVAVEKLFRILVRQVVIGEEEGRDKVSPDVRGLEAGQKDAIELVQLLLRQLLRQV